MEQATTFYDIYEYYYIPVYQELWFILLLIFFGIIIVGLIGFWIYKKRFRPLLPWEWAMQEIVKLRSLTYESKSDYKRFYFTITNVLKSYLEKRYSWDTKDKTDEELSTFLQLHGFNSDLLEGLKKMLMGASWIKFANEDAIKAQFEEDIKTVEIIIKKTIPTKKDSLRPG